jgi:multiple antibiotic resistance protein
MTATEFALVAISSLIAIMEPFSTTAVFMSLTEGMDEKVKRKIVSKSMKVSAVILIFFAISGSLLFSLFSITLYAFQIAGGILLVTVALNMLNPGKEEPSFRSEDIAIVPIAIPLTAGPGSITAVMLLSSQASGLLEIPIVYVGIIVSVAISYFALRYSHRLSKLMGKDGLRILTALMAIIILAIAVQFIINGISTAVIQILAAA